MLTIKADTDWNKGIPWKFQITNQTLSIVLLLLVSGSPKMEDHSDNSNELYTHTHDDVYYGSTLSSKTRSNKIVVIA